MSDIKIITTPILEAKYISVTKPQLKYKATSKLDTDYEYKASLILIRGNKEHDEFVERIDMLVDSSYQENIKEIKMPKRESMRKKYPYTDEYENDELTGRVILHSSINYIKPNGDKRFIDIVDTKNNPIPNSIVICNGSHVRAKCIVKETLSDSHNTIGIKLYLIAVQIHELVEYKKTSFDESDTGFIVPSDMLVNMDEVNSQMRLLNNFNDNEPSDDEVPF